MLKPLVKKGINNVDKIIYTNLTEAFFSYLKLCVFVSFLVTIPVLNWHIYRFISPGLVKQEKKIAAYMFFLSPVLFALGFIFVFYFVMPKTWEFLISFEKTKPSLLLPLVLQAKISEYLELVMQFILAFGIAFQLPIVMVILKTLGTIDYKFLKKFRKISIVLSFTISAILTPPDVLSQFCLAIPLILLYEISILILKYLDKDVRHKMDKK